MRQIFILFLSILVLSGEALGQEAAKIIRKELVVNLRVGNNKELIISVEEFTSKKIIDQSRVTGYMQKDVFFYEEAFETEPTVEAYSLIPKKNGRMKKQNVTSIQEEDHITSGIFYSGTKKKIVNFPSVESGAELHSKFSYHVKDPHLLPTFFFNDYLSCDSSILKITASPSVDLGYLEFMYGFEDKIKFTKTETNGSIQYVWRAGNLAPRKYEGNSGGISCTNPHVVMHVKSYSIIGEPDVNVLRNEADLFNWYSSLVQDFELSDTYKSILDSLNSDAPEKSVLAERIFNWVQHNVKYIAYEEGIEGFQPHDPNDVVKNRFGDCKDMAVLTSTMMKQSGIDCYYAWVGTRDKCYTYNACPTPVVDNHMIAAYPVGDDFIFLDATSTYSEFGVPSGFVQGKEAMIRISPDKFVVKEIPVIDADYSVDLDSISVTIEEDVLLGEGKNKLTGYLKVDYENALTYSDLTPEKLFINYHDLGNKSFAVSDLNQENTNSNRGDLTSTYAFKVNNYVETFENSIYLNPFIKSVIYLEVSERTKLRMLDNKYKRGAKIQIVLEEGMSVVSGIESSTIKENGLELTIDFQQKGNIIEVEYVFTNNLMEILPEDYEGLKRTLQIMKKSLKQRIELKYDK